MEPTEGFEPTTRCLQNSRSDQLSYVGKLSRSKPATPRILPNFGYFFNLNAVDLMCAYFIIGRVSIKALPRQTAREPVVDPILRVLLDTFVGGELEVQNRERNYSYRGGIAAIESVPGTKEEGAHLTIELAWNAASVDADGQPSQLPSGGWVESANLAYTCSTELPSPEQGAPNLPNVQLLANGRLLITNPYRGELTVLLPKTDSKLDHSRIKQLPDGPLSKLGVVTSAD
jgi:hypothetical protein